MTMPVRHLPVLQDWDCQGCGNCCHDYQIGVSPDEKRRIEEQGWDKDPELAGQAIFERIGWWRPRYRLHQRADGACVFLDDKGLCRIHARFGAEAKPLACRFYPFVLVPVDDHLRVGLRFSCPTVAASEGKPLKEHDLSGFARELTEQSQINKDLPPPRLAPGVMVSWGDLLRFVRALADLISARGIRLERRWRLCLGLARLCRQAKFESVQGQRLDEFLDLVSAGLRDEIPDKPTALPEPTWVGKVLFREALALYSRTDHGRDRGSLPRTRLSLLGSASRFIRGKGPVPRIHAALGEVTFEEIEERSTGLEPADEEILERYYLTKLGSLQFCGPANRGLTFWQGVGSLALTFPLICWLTRALGGGKREHVLRALRMVDHHFGFNPILGSFRQRFAVNLMIQREEVDRLIARYGR